MRSSQVVTTPDCQRRSCNSPWFDPSILQYSEFEGWQMKQCGIRKEKKSPLCLINVTLFAGVEFNASITMVQ